MASDVKWIKIYTDMLNNKKIKRIRKMPEGNNIILIWVFLLTTAGESNKNGGIFLTDTIPFNEEDLAIEFDFDVSVIKFALITLEKFEMVEIFDAVIYIKNWSEYQNIEGLDKMREQTRLRVAKHREKKVGILGEYEDKTCAYCGNAENTTIDHLIPTSRGGLDVKENCIFACRECNMSKTNMDLDVFLNNLILLGKKINIKDILKNKKIMNVVYYENNKFSMIKNTCNVTCNANVTCGNATELELELELDKEVSIIPYQEIIDYLNKICSTKYRYVESHKKHIRARWNEKYSLDDFKTVIDKKSKQWLNTKDSIYLRPETLFGTKFDGYLNQVDIPKQQNNYNSQTREEIPLL